MNGRAWTDAEIETVKQLYPSLPTAEVARRIGRSVSQVYQSAARHGLTKTPEYLASPAACRLRRGDGTGASTRFKPGQVPANKGLRRPGWSSGRMPDTQFKAGAKPANYCPVGTVKKDTEGFLRIKVRERLPGEPSGFGSSRVWPMLNRHIWEQHHGTIPPKHAVVFKDRNRDNCDISNLECIPRRELMARNTVHNLPKELAEVIQLTGALNRKLRRREREKQVV